jgi:hypothetical protein
MSPKVAALEAALIIFAGTTGLLGEDPFITKQGGFQLPRTVSKVEAVQLVEEVEEVDNIHKVDMGQKVQVGTEERVFQII